MISLPQTIITPDQDAVISEIDIAAPPERVFRAISDAEEIRRRSPDLDVFEMRTVVRWELTPTKSGTHVKLTHSGLASEPESRKSYAGGWPSVLEELKQFVEA